MYWGLLGNLNSLNLRNKGYSLSALLKHEGNYALNDNKSSSIREVKTSS